MAWKSIKVKQLVVWEGQPPFQKKPAGYGVYFGAFLKVPKLEVLLKCNNSEKIQKTII